MKDNQTKENLKEEESKNNKKNKITYSHLINLDKFIQNCLDKFKFIDPKTEFYDVTGEDKDLIISHKSTIPDLVIWNKKFNKNECFYDADTLEKENSFPRFSFYLRIKSNKPDKEKKKEKKNEKEKNNEKKEKNKRFKNETRITNKSRKRNFGAFSNKIR